MGAQTNIDPKDDRWIINGAHEASKLQDYLDGFINKFVLCRNCKNPETVVNIKEGRILLDCKACGQRTEVDPRQKLASFIVKNQPKKGKKDKSTKKADRKARKEAERNGDANGNGHGSPGDSNSDQGGDDNDDGDADGASDDELYKRINAEAKELNDPAQKEKEIEWTVDTSEAAVKARLNGLPDDLKRTALVDEDEEGEGEGSSYDQLGKWVLSTAEEKGGVAEVSDVDIYLKAKELHVDTKHKTLAVLAQTIFDDGIVKQIDARAGMLKRMITSERHEKAFLGGTERFVGSEKPQLISQVSAILLKYYENDLVSEEVLKAWGSKASKKYVDISTSKKVRKSAEKFIEWLETAESDEESDDE